MGFGVKLVVVVVEVIKILTHQLPHHIQDVKVFVGGCYSYMVVLNEDKKKWLIG